MDAQEELLVVEASPGSGRNAETREPLQGDSGRPASKSPPVSASGCQFTLEIYIRWLLWFSFDRMRSPAGGGGDRSVFRGAPGPLAQAGAPACPPSGGPAPGSSLFPSSTWSQLRADDFTSQTSCGSVSATCLPHIFPFRWAPGSTTFYRLPRLGGAESLSSGHQAARCRCGPCQARPQTSRRTHHPAPSLPCWSSAGYQGSLLGLGKPGPLDGVVCIPEGPSHARPAYTQAPSGPAGRKCE